MSASLRFTQDIPLRYRIDVLVAGGGPSGVAAAVFAARCGASVLLVESQNCLGGMGTAGLVPCFCKFSDGVNFLASGIGSEVYDRMFELKGNGPNDDNNICKELCINAEVLKRVYDQLVIAAKVKVLLCTSLVAVQADNGNVEYIVCSGKSGLFAVNADVYIDCTGDGDLAAWAGAEFELGDEDGNMQPGTLCSSWTDVDWKQVNNSGGNRYARAFLEKAFEENHFTVKDLHMPGFWQLSDNIAGGNIGHAFNLDSTDENSITDALFTARKTISEYEYFFKKYVSKGYSNMKLVSTGSLLGVRESRRIKGDYKLCLKDFKDRAVFDDEIGRYCYAVDVHPSSPDKSRYKEFKDKFDNLRYSIGESYGIPYRILTPAGLQNVLVAGRCVSVDRPMQGSIRVMPGCFITGQAAGAAAAITVNNATNIRGFDVSVLQKKLLENGAFLPNTCVL